MNKYRHGSSDSTDVDVVYVFDEIPDRQEALAFCSSKEENRNIVVIQNGVVVWCLKGHPDEVNNSIHTTIPLHGGVSPITRLLPRNEAGKAIRAMRGLVSYLSRGPQRSLVKASLRDPSWRNKCRVMNDLDFTINPGKGHVMDYRKVAAFQIGQCLALPVELYTKGDIATYFPSLRPYLYREEVDVGNLLLAIRDFQKWCSELVVDERDGLVLFRNGEWWDIIREVKV